MANPDNTRMDQMDYNDGYNPDHWLPIGPDAEHDETKRQSPTPSTSSGNIIPSTWTSLLQAHETLIQNQTSMDKRKFNKNALELLNQTMSMLQHHVQTCSLPSPVSPPFQQHSADLNALKEVLGDFRSRLLNSKEVASEELVDQVVTHISYTLSPLLTADEKREELQKKCLAFVQELSPQLSIKVGPIIKSYIARQFGAGIEDMLAEVRLPDMPLQEKTHMYTRMLNNFLNDAGCISFACSNRQLLGNILPVDLWFLTFFAFVTARRCRGDNILMLGCSGKSSVGKSLLFESVVLATGHQIISSTSNHSGDAGVGRFQTGSKNTVVFHDINIATLVGVDVERVKSLARSETTIVKIHSSTSTVSPMFVFFTSNERLFRHVIPPKNSSTGLQQTFSSQVEMTSKKRISSENLEAVRARFLELFVHKAPKQLPSDLERAGTFERHHFILGTFDKALALLEKYKVNDFHSLYLPAYVLSGLVKNHSMMETTMCSGTCLSNHSSRLEQLKLKYNINV